LYVDLETVLSADIITLHVPLEKTGRYPTYHLVNADFLAKLRDDVILINVLDVWNNEPHINLSLLQRVATGTPHIAGYSLDGKMRGTQMLYAAVCDYFKRALTWQTQSCLPTPPLTRLSFSKTVDDDVAIHTAVMACYDVRRDDAVLRRVSQATHPGAYFDNLRKNYPVRREFSCVEIELPTEK